MSNINFVYLAFGSASVFHVQTYFSALTVLRHKRTADKVMIYTDHPQYYVRLGGSVSVMPLSKQMLDEWIGGSGYIYRAKIKAVEHCAECWPGAHTLFLDCDTCLMGSIDPVASLLDDDAGLMHKDEGHPSTVKGASLRGWRAIGGKKIGSCVVSMRHNMWNSGVVGIPAGKSVDVCRLATDVCDAILASGARCFTAEQYGFSVAMQEHFKMFQAEQWIAHYWGNKDEWNRCIGEFVMKSHICGLSLDAEISALDDFPMATLPLYVRKPNTQRRLVKFVKWAFKDEIQER